MIPSEFPGGAPGPDRHFIPSDSGVSDSVRKTRETAIRLEATFLSEMLKSAGFGTQSSMFSDSKDEDHFASFQRDAIAERMVRAGGIGLAEHFFNAMMEAKRNE
ncbi:MAG: rod-binding protein [Pseudomonadota bacterium]